MPSRCWILGCPSNVDRSNTKFFKFPQSEDLRQLWIEAIKRDVEPTDFSRVCSKHFKPEDVIPHNSGGGPCRILLKNDAVPSVFEGLLPRRPGKKSSPKKGLSPKEPKDPNAIRRNCCVPKCKTNSKSTSALFKFPTDLERRQLWLEKINRENYKPNSTSVVCIKHFEESCIVREEETTQDDDTESVVSNVKLTLTDDAVPTIFEDLSSNNKTSTPKKKRVIKKKKDNLKTEDVEAELDLEKEKIAYNSSANESMNKSDEVSNTDVQDLVDDDDEEEEDNDDDDDEKETLLSGVALTPSAPEIEKNINISSTTHSPIITVLKAQDDPIKRPSGKRPKKRKFAGNRYINKDKTPRIPDGDTKNETLFPSKGEEISISDEEDEEIIPLEQLKSPIIKSHLKKFPNELPSPYKHLPSVSVCLKEEDRVILTQDESKSLKRSSSVSSNSVSENSKSSPVPKRRKVDKPAPLVLGRQNDAYCWVCHRENVHLSCIACPRAYHLKCSGEISEQSDWVCLECRRILTAENVDTRSSVLSEISLDRLCALLRFCLNKMKHRAGIPFHNAVSLEHYPMYLHYVIHPMDFTLLEKNIKQKLYGCTEAFLADVKWILHNSCVFNGGQHALSTNARGLVKTCENDMQEIEICPDCFMHSVIRNKYWFADVCRKPHPLVWAKLKGFPYWPAKVVRILDGNVDARFFGAHDRAWVPINQCYHLSKETPTTSKPKKKGTYEAAIDELNVHVQLLIQKFGSFDYASPRTVFDPKNKKLMYHGIDIDKIDKEEIPFDPSAANNKEYCPSPTDERRMSLDSKMDVDQCEDASTSSLFSSADTQISHMLSCDEDKEIPKSSKDKTENKTQETVSKKSDKDKEIDLTLEDSCKSKPISNVPRDKLEKVLERIKGYVSLEVDEEKESSKEEESDESEPVKKTSISSDGTPSILANLIKSKNLPKIDLPDIPAIEEEATTKEKENFLDLSKKNDTFTLHLLETIKKAKSRAVAEDEEDDSDMETDEEDSESDEEHEDGKEATEENESQEDEGKEVVEGVSASEEEGDDTESESESESSSESSDTDIEEMEEESSTVDKNAEKQNENSENNNPNHKDNEVTVSPVISKESNSAIESNDPKETSAITSMNKDAKSVKNSPQEKSLDKSSEPNINNIPINKTLDKQQEDPGSLKKLKDTEINQNKAKEKETKNEDMEDDEVIICPPVKAPTPPLICLDDDDGTETECDNLGSSKTADAPVRLLEKNENSILVQAGQPLKKPSVVRYLQFNGNEVSPPTEKSPKDSSRHIRRKRRRTPVSSSDDESSDDGLLVDRNTGVPLRGARRTFNNFKNRPASIAKSNSSVEDQEVNEPSIDNSESRSVDRRKSVDNLLAEPSSITESRLSFDQSILADGFNQDSNSDNGPLDPKDEEIMRLKKKFATLFTAFRLQHWKNNQEKLELRHNMNLIIMEMRASLEADKKQAIETLSRTFERFKQKAIDEVKRNQWCAFCLKEARYQCCWNTNYCSINCQKRNFSVHKNSCNQVKKNNPGITEATTATNQPKDNKKVFVVNMVPKNDAKTQVQILPANSNVVFSSPTNTAVPNTNVQYILAQPPVKTTPKSNSSISHDISSQEGKQVSIDSSEMIENVKNRNVNLSTATSITKKKNLENEGTHNAEENKTDESDIEEIYFPFPPQVSFEELDSANADKNIQINQTKASKKNSSDTEILGQEDKKGESSAEEDFHLSDNDEADNEQVSIGNGVEVKAKFLNKCLIYGKTAKRLTRCLVDVLFPDLKQLATCSAFGQKSNVSKTTRAALPGKKVAAILEFVRKRFPAATRTEIVLAINMKCKEARSIVDKQDGEKPVKKTLFRRLLARDQSLEVNKTASSTSTSTSVSFANSSNPAIVSKPPIMIMRPPPNNQNICIKSPQLSPLSETLTPPAKIVTSPNILRCTPQVLVKPPSSQKTIRTLLPRPPQPIGFAPVDNKNYFRPMDAYKQSGQPQTSSSGRPYIIIGNPASSSPQSLPVTQPTSLPSSILRK